MKQLISFIIILFFIVLIVYASNGNKDSIALIGGTELNGNGCVCHTTVRDYSVNVWVEGPDTLHAGEMGLYKMFLYGGPAEGGGYNVAGRFGEMELVDTLSYRHPLALNELTQAFPLPFPTPEDTIYWAFGYVPSDSSETDTIYSCGLSLVFDGIPDSLDRWNFGPKFPIVVLPNVTSIDDANNGINNFRLFQNYPNPFNPATKIQYEVGSKQFVSLKVFDVLGNEVADLVNEEKSAGFYTVQFNAGTLAGGIYFLQLRTKNYADTKKMVLLK